MVDLDFEVVKAEPEAFAITPTLAFALEVRQNPAKAVRIHSAILRCQIRLQPARRKYSSSEQEHLKDLFDSPHRWSQTLQPMLWAHTSVVLPAFTEQAHVKLQVPCTFDFNVAATKYFDALEDGEAPLLLLFSGTVFYENAGGELQISQIPWEKETTFRLSVRVWKKLMLDYYPNTAWLCLRKDLFDELARFKSEHGLPTLELALERLLSNQRAQAATLKLWEAPELVGEIS